MTPFFKTTRHDYCIDGVFVRLVNCPIKGDHRALMPTAETWLRYALNTWGAGVADLTVKWDEHGRVTHSVEFEDGMTLTEKIRQKQEAAHVRTGDYIRHRKRKEDTQGEWAGNRQKGAEIE